jgi:hypothetical protein
MDSQLLTVDPPNQRGLTQNKVWKEIIKKFVTAKTLPHLQFGQAVLCLFLNIKSNIVAVVCGR